MAENPLRYVLGSIEKCLLPDLSGWFSGSTSDDQSKPGCSLLSLLGNVSCRFVYSFSLTNLVQRKVKVD